MSKFTVVATVKDIASARAIAAGCAPDYFRINASHVEVDGLRDFAAQYASDAQLRATPLYIDLQGSKLRVDRRQPKTQLALGSTVTVQATSPSSTAALAAGAIHVAPRVIELLAPGTAVAMDDGKIALEVLEVGKSDARARVVRAGELLPGKGFNLRPHPVTLETLSERDRAIVAATRAHDCVRYALSFAATPEEVRELKDLSKRFVCIKLERPLERAQIEAMLRAGDELWVCRGDMGVQMGGLGPLARWYSEFVRGGTLEALLATGRPVIMAGEVLEHVRDHNEPTRSEACHLADLRAVGFAGIVLSNETAVGVDPVAAVRHFRDIAACL
eukprot:m51a1_g9359 pyruvate kinase, putative (331) ;mRNA; r:152625-153737